MKVRGLSQPTESVYKAGDQDSACEVLWPLVIDVDICDLSV